MTAVGVPGLSRGPVTRRTVLSGGLGATLATVLDRLAAAKPRPKGLFADVYSDRY